MSAAHDDGHGGHGDDNHGHSPWIQHHYDDAQHQFDSGKLGIWLFLAQEVLFFSALFVAYVLYRHHHPDIYAYAHKYLDVKFGAINTAVLIFSSLTAAWAVRAAQLRQRKLLIACLATTLVCAMTFLGIKYIEYTHKVHEHLLFGRYFDPCINPNNSPMLTKNNACPGSKGSVIWDADKGAPDIGCFPAFAIDQKPTQPGVQAECVVEQAEFTKATDDKNAPLVNPDTKTSLFYKPANPKPIAKQCDPRHDWGPHTGESCWKVSRQPAVCRPGWFYGMRCQYFDQPGGKVAGMMKLEAEYAAMMATLEGTKGEARNDAAKPKFDKLKKEMGGLWIAARCDKTEQYSYSTWNATQSDCNAAKSKREGELKAIRDQEAAAQCPKPVETGDKAKNEELAKARTECIKGVEATLLKYSFTDCVRTDQVGFVVAHPNHDVIPATTAVTAVCKPPEKPRTDLDPFAETQRQLSVGAKSAGTPEPSHGEHGAHYAGPPPEHTGMFFTIYFAMTGLHGIHVLVGVFIFIWLLIRAVKGHFTPEYFGPIDWAALYWHIVDLIWIFLFPLMYLIH